MSNNNNHSTTENISEQYLNNNFVYTTLGILYVIILILSILVLKMFYSKKEKYGVNKLIDENIANLGDDVNIQVHGTMPKPIEMAKIIYSSNTAIKYLIQQGVLKVPLQCQCGGNMVLKKRNGQPNTFYRCSKRACNVGVSILKNTFFGKTKVRI